MTAPVSSQTLHITSGLRLQQRRWLVWVGDSLIAVLCAGLALWLWSLANPIEPLREFVLTRWVWLLVLPGLWLTNSFAFFNLHRIPHPESVGRDALGAALVSLLLYIGFYFVAQPFPLPRTVVIYFLTMVTLATLAWRAGYVSLFSLPFLQRRLLVVGAGKAGRAIVEALHDEANSMYTVVGILDDDEAKHGQNIKNIRVLGGQADLAAAIRTYDVSDVVLAISGDLQPRTFQALLDCQSRGMPLIRMSTLYEEITGRVPLEHLDAQWLEGPAVSDFNHSIYFAAKRLVDIVGALIGLAGVLVALPFVAAAIKLEDGGRVFYRQVRLGRNGRPFTIIKFRTMVPDAEAGGAQWARENDDRVTRVGRFLRRTRLDETTQFWNVLRGDMSLVGPRPERPEFFTDLERKMPLFRARLLVKPGISGWAQVNYGYASTLQDNIRKLQWDLFYVKHMSPWLDTSILLRTIGVVVRLKGT